MSTTEKEVFRPVPYRFLLNESNADSCKLERLTNLFPDMKASIELELFKINNLTRMIERLSAVYTLSTVVDTRDDSQHLFLGPYHITLGPAILGALHFKNLSTALLASSHSKTKTDNSNQPHQQHSKKRRHEAVLRRFRRSVRKLIFIRSILDQLRIASVLTPCNQYELYTQGIYDLVLAGHIHNSSSAFNDDSFTEQLEKFHSMKNLGKENSLLASRFIKINALLHLLAPITQQQTENNLGTGKTSQTISDDPKTFNENQTKSLLDSTNMCCVQHCQNIPVVMIPINRSSSYQSTNLLTPDTYARRSSTHKKSSRRSSVQSNQNTTASLPDLTADETVNRNIPSPKPIEVESDKSKAITTIRPQTSSRLIKNQEEILVDNISSLLTNYFLSQQSIETSSQTSDSQEIADEGIRCVSPMSDHSSSIMEINEFDNLLQRIKTTVDNNLSVKLRKKDQTLFPSPTTITNNRRPKLTTLRSATFHEASIDEFDPDSPTSSTKKNKLNRSSKTQSFDETNLS